MARTRTKKNNTAAILIFIFCYFIGSYTLMDAGIEYASRPENKCIHHLGWFILFIEMLVPFVPLAGLVRLVFWNRNKCLLVFNLFCIALLIVILLVLLVFVFLGAKTDGSYVVPGRGYKEYRLEGFSSFLRNQVSSSGKWVVIRTCLADSNVCAELSQDYNIDSSADTSPLQSGCCKPPTVCGYGYVNTTLWINPTNVTADPDCYMWSNDQSQLCYGCNACKAGLLGNLIGQLRMAKVTLGADLMLLVLVFQQYKQD